MMKNNINNNLMLARRRRGLSRKQVAGLLGYRGTSTVARQEQGKLSPSLLTLLRLEILYRTPVAFLYSEVYTSLKEDLRAREENLLRPRSTPAEEGLGYAKTY
jgi:transcriptional regulator with XRE-family HTH domain